MPPLQSTDELEDLSDADLTWPIPFTVLESPESAQRILFQSDRIAIEWDFGDGEHSYPGFLALRGELLDRYQELSEIYSRNNTDAALECFRAEAQYLNNIGRVKTLVLLQSPITAAVGEDSYESFTRHYHWNDDAAGWVTYTDSPEDDTELRIRQQWDFSGLPNIGAEEALDACHDEVIKAFVAWTTVEMRNEWH